MTLTIGTVAFIICAWYLFRGEIVGRGQLIFAGLAAASLSFLSGWAARGWDLAGTGVEVIGKIGGAASRTGGLIVGAGLWW